MQSVTTNIGAREDDNEDGEDFPELTGEEDDKEWYDDRDIPKYCPGCAYDCCRCELL